MLIKSFPAEYNLYIRFLERVQTSNPFWASLWFSSELVGEAGLILRFAGGCLFLAFTWLLFKQKQLTLPYLRKALMLEGAYYLFILPFIISLFARPNTTLVNVEAGLSYTLQIVLITPAFFYLAYLLGRPKVNHNLVTKWGAISVISFVFALWIKHFLLNLYALPINFSNPTLLLGFLNSTITILAAGLILTAVFIPIIRQKQRDFNQRTAGSAFLLIGFYSIGYLAMSFLNQSYFNYLFLTEVWIGAFVFLGIGYVLKGNTSTPPTKSNS